MATIRLLKSSGLVLVNCFFTDQYLKAGWGHTKGMLPETIEFGEHSIKIPQFMQTDPIGGELFIKNDTIDFEIV